MGFDLQGDGLHIVLSKEVPDLIRSRIRGLTDQFLARHALTREHIRAYMLHPGGQKLLSYMQEELELCQCQVEPSWHVLQRYGNLSSASVLFVADEWMSRGEQSGTRGLLAAFGPGFSAEMLLVQWL
jgi:alkylresorcinol/alkylpyrone synthase